MCHYNIHVSHMYMILHICTQTFVLQIHVSHMYMCHVYTMYMRYHNIRVSNICKMPYIYTNTCTRAAHIRAAGQMFFPGKYSLFDRKHSINASPRLTECNE